MVSEKRIFRVFGVSVFLMAGSLPHTLAQVVCLGGELFIGNLRRAKPGGDGGQGLFLERGAGGGFIKK